MIEPHEIKDLYAISPVDDNYPGSFFDAEFQPDCLP